MSDRATDCPICGEYLYADEEWRLMPGFVPGTKSDPSKQEYAHADCLLAENEVK